MTKEKFISFRENYNGKLRTRIFSTILLAGGDFNLFETVSILLSSKKIGEAVIIEKKEYDSFYKFPVSLLLCDTGKEGNDIHLLFKELYGVEYARKKYVVYYLRWIKNKSLNFDVPF